MSTELTTAPIAELQEIAIKSGLEKANLHAFTFAPFMQNVIEISEKLTTLSSTDPSNTDMKIARECRLSLVKNRTATAKMKDNCKATLLAEGNLIQSLHNVVVSKSALIEADFEAIEKVAEIKEAARKAELQKERENKLFLFELDLTAYNLAEMSEQTFSDLLISQKLLKEERDATAARLEAERLQNERLEAEERDRIRKENEKLRADAEAKEKQLEKERKDAQAAADKLKAENDAKLSTIEESNRIAREKAQKEQDAKHKAAAAELAKQKAAADKLAAELKAKQDAENKAAADAEAKNKAEQAAAAKAAKAPLKEKMKIWVNDFKVPENTPDCLLSSIIADKFSAFKSWALTQIEEL